MSLRFASIALCSALATLAGCSAGTEAPLGTGSAPIINGVASGPDDDAAIGIALMSGGSFAGFCSGVLIAENLVLTARHCVSNTGSGGIACTKDGKPISGGTVGADHAPSDLQVLVGASARMTFDAKGIQILHPDVRNLCNNDIALIVLDHKLAGAKLAQIRLDTPPVKGETITAVGWGVSNNSRGYGRRRRASIPIVGVGPSAGGSIGGAIGSGEFAIGEGICSGDSGGPAFDSKSGAVIGVVSRGGNGNPGDPSTDPSIECVDTVDYVTHNIYTRTDAFKDIIMQGFEAAGGEPWLEGGPDPRKAKFGETCGSPEECRSALCIGTPSGQICSQICATDNPCPDGYSCVDAGGATVCAPKVEPPPATTSKKGCSYSGETGGSQAFLVAFAALSLAVARRRRK